MSRTASTVFGALSSRMPLLAAIEYSSCLLTWNHGQNRERQSTHTEAPLTLTSSNAMKRVRERTHAQKHDENIRALAKEIREPESAPLPRIGKRRRYRKSFSGNNT